MEEEMKIASAPDMMDDLNQLSLMLFKKPLKDLTDDEYDRLQEYAEEKLAKGGRAGFAEGTDNMKMASASNYKNYVKAALALGLKPIRIDEFDSLTTIFDINQILKMTDDLNKRTSNATGGRVGYQTGGITEQRVLPPEFI